MTPGASERVAAVVGAVAAAALRDRRARRVALLDDGGAEAALAARFLEGTLGSAAVVRVRGGGGAEVSRRAAEEERRYRARLIEDALVAHPASKTTLLLEGELPPEPLLPLGDLWASEVLALAGGGAVPRAVATLAEASGGIEALDAALRRRFDLYDPNALDRLPAPAAAELRSRLAVGAASRRWPRVVPKLSGRTLCTDLFE